MNEIDYINAYKGYRKWQKLVYGMIPCRVGRAITAMVTIAGVVNIGVTDNTDYQSDSHHKSSN